MKIRKFTLLSLFMFISFSLAFASGVGVEKAKQVGKNYYYDRISAEQSIKYNDISITETIEIKREGKLVAYIFNLNVDGWILVSAEDVVKPVLAYNTTGIYLKNDVPPAFQEILTSYSDLIDYAQSTKMEASEGVKSLWEKYSIDGKTYPTKGVTVGPLCATVWHQLGPYNLDCPNYTTATTQYCNKAAVGCVATAMAQVMKFWSWPTQGTGSSSSLPQYSPVVSFNTTYDWASMPNSIPQIYTCVPITNTITQAQIDAVALINYHCGKSVKMSYGGTSGSETIDVVTALETYFKYSTDAQYLTASSYNATTWKNMLRTNLDGGMPLVYRGTNTSGGGGHAFVCDGYRDNEEFHFNMGWGPNYLPWCTLDGLVWAAGTLPYQQGNGNLTANHAAIFDIHPLNLDVDNAVKGNDELTLTPNPTNDIVNINFSSTKSQNVSVKVMDIVGNVVVNKEYNVNSGVVNNKLDLSKLSGGLYFVSVLCDDIKTTKKIIVK